MEKQYEVGELSARYRDSDPDGYYNCLLDLFKDKGWSIVVDELLLEARSTRLQALDAKSWDDVLVLRGREQAILYIASLAALVQAQYKDWLDSEVDASVGEAASY